MSARGIVLKTTAFRCPEYVIYLLADSLKVVSWSNFEDGNVSTFPSDGITLQYMDNLFFFCFLNLFPMDLGISSPTGLPSSRRKNCSKSFTKLKPSASTCSILKTTALLHVPVFLMTRNSHHGNSCPRLTGSLNESCMWVPIKSTKSLSFFRHSNFANQRIWINLFNFS